MTVKWTWKNPAIYVNLTLLACPKHHKSPWILTHRKVTQRCSLTKPILSSFVKMHCRAPPLCRTPLEMESRRMFPWYDLDIPRALWRSTAFPCQHQCRRQESGKVGIPASNHSPQLLFGPHPGQSQSTQHPRCSDPDRLQLNSSLNGMTLKHVKTSGFHGNNATCLTEPGLCPIISSTCLTEDEVVWAEQLAEGSGTNAIHGACSTKERRFHLKDILL